MQTLIAAERRDLAAVLAGLTPAQWEAQSLCSGWRVREVAAHLSLPFRYSTFQVLRGILGARGSFDTMADRWAHADATTMTPDQLTAAIGDNADFAWKPPGGGPAGALCHDVIHGLDITVALGLDRRVPEERLRPVLDAITVPRRLRTMGADIEGLSWSPTTWTGASAAAPD